MKNIGILKVLGFTNNHILFVYLIRYLILSILGSLIGLITSGYFKDLAWKDVYLYWKQDVSN